MTFTTLALARGTIFVQMLFLITCATVLYTYIHGRDQGFSC